jgi:cell division protein FtsB
VTFGLALIMNKSAKQRQQTVKTRRKILRVAGLLFAFYILLSFFLGDMGLLRYIKMRHQKEDLTREIAALRSTNDELDERVKSLKTDPDYMEGLAREQGMVKDGETIYQYEDQK